MPSETDHPEHQQPEHPSSDQPSDSPEYAEQSASEIASPGHSPAFVASPPPDPQAAHSPPRTNPKPPDQPQAGSAPPVVKPGSSPAMSSGTRLVANLLLIALGAGLMAGGFGLGRLYAPPRPPGETADKPTAADMVKPEDFKKLNDEVVKQKSTLDDLSKQITSRPDYRPEIEMQRDKLTQLSGMVSEFNSRFDSINQKLETISRTQTAQSGDAPAPTDLSRRVTDIAQIVDNLRADLNARGGTSNARAVSSGDSANGNGNPPHQDLIGDAQAMEQAVDLFKDKKYPQARDAFRKLQAVYPTDARVWYYSALANGFTTGDWLNETQRLVNVGIEREKAGTPDSTKIDAMFAGLTPATGRGWLADYRKRVK